MIRMTLPIPDEWLVTNIIYFQQRIAMEEPSGVGRCFAMRGSSVVTFIFRTGKKGTHLTGIQYTRPKYHLGTRTYSATESEVWRLKELVSRARYADYVQ